MGPSTIPENFYLYLGRSSDSPGTLYLAKSFETAEALCRGLTEDGYIVKVIHMASNVEFELHEGKLCPTDQIPSSPEPSNHGPASQGPSSHGMSSALA
jgi:hypothetical protein